MPSAQPSDPEPAKASQCSARAAEGAPPEHDTLDRAFLVALVLKGFNGAIELIGGMLLLVATPEFLATLAQLVTREELSEDPSDFFATRLLQLAHSSDLTTGSLRFAAAYLILHGAVKLVLVMALLRGRLWAYPWMIGFLLAFICYQVFRFVQHPSWTLLALTAFDAVLTWLTWREWRRHRSSAAPQRSGVEDGGGAAG